jgi:hypothetical protein
MPIFLNFPILPEVGAKNEYEHKYENEYEYEQEHEQ